LPVDQAATGTEQVEAVAGEKKRWMREEGEGVGKNRSLSPKNFLLLLLLLLSRYEEDSCFPLYFPLLLFLLPHSPPLPPRPHPLAWRQL
jgi:hypothetical protein